MFTIKKYRYKPVYKKFANLKIDINNRQKIFKFKKTKWKNFLFKLKLKSKFKKRNCYYKFYDQNSFNVTKFSNYFSKEYKQNLLKKRGFMIFYGKLGKKYLKNIVHKSVKKANNLNNTVNSVTFFDSMLEKRLDIVLLKSNFVLNTRNARQLILHGHVLVNNKTVKNSSFLIKTGDKISLKKKIHNLVQYYILKSDMWPIPGKHFQVNYRTLQIRVIEDLKTLNSVNVQFDLNNIMNSYKK